MLPLRHHISPAGGGPVAAWDDNSDLQAQEDAVRHYGLCHSDWKSLIIFFLNSRFQALKERFESKLSPESCYSRGGVLA